MATYDYLRKQALKDVWRVPTLDRQFIIEPRRITKTYGRKKNVTVVWETLRLPDDTSTWHVYDAGPVSMMSLNLFRKCTDWTSLSDATNNRGVYINAYISSGVELPRFDSFYRYTDVGSLIFAFKVNKRTIPKLDVDKVFIRVYSSASVNGVQLPLISATPHIQTSGRYVTTVADIAALQTSIDALPTDGRTNIYHNGIWYDSLDKITITIGDWIEFIYDQTFYKSYEFAISDLYHYNSLMDSDQKYLLHHTDVSNALDFYDDIDVYIIQKENNQPLRGVYFHKNSVAAVRQLTHRDYGLRTRNIPPIASVIQGLDEPTLDAPASSLFIRLDIRRPALTNNVLVYEHTRLFELYKLPSADIVRAFQGIDSNVPFWTAPALEQSFYTLGMRCSYNELTKELAESIFGYNASSKIVGDTPVKLTTIGLQDVVLPIRMQHGCTVYEYDADGLFLEWHQHMAGQTYRPHNLLTAYVEAIVGLGSDRLDQVHNVKSLTLNELYTYRVYNGSLVGNVVQNVFEDVTGSDKYTIVDNEFTWVSPRTIDYPIVMSDSRFFAKDYRVRPQFGSIKLLLTTQQIRPQGDGIYKMPFPMGQMDIILNGHSLIKDLDYFVNFPEVIIVNKEYLVDAQIQDQKIHIRFCGFATRQLEMAAEGDIGFVEHGLLSNNNRYDLRDDKVQRIIIDGKLYTKSELVFSENHSGISIVDAANGKPYMVKDMLVPVKPFTTSDMYALRNASKQVDKIVSDYLTLKLPQPARGDVMAIPNKYHVFSPFVNTLITDIRSGSLNLPTRIDGFSKQEVIDVCKRYEYILKFDPIKSPYIQDERFVAIDPHGYPNVVSVSANAYRFLTKVVEVYCDGRIILSPFLKTA